jgi:RimJ/RimL family protein N-acetyltransferase
MSGAQELRTARLRLRRWQPEDEAAMAQINDDPEVMRYLNRPVGTAATRGFFEAVTAHWAEHGFGFWAVESREPDLRGRFIGFIGVGYPSFIPALAARTEIGWRLARHAWGRGLASEGAAAARDDAFERLGLPELISIIHPENVRSQRLAAKLGMSLAELVHNPAQGQEVELWQLRRATPGRSAPRD